MKERIEYAEKEITKQIIETDFKHKKTGKEEYIKMTKLEYLKRLLKLIKSVK